VFTHKYNHTCTHNLFVILTCHKHIHNIPLQTVPFLVNTHTHNGSRFYLLFYLQAAVFLNLSVNTGTDVGKSYKEEIPIPT